MEIIAELVLDLLGKITRNNKNKSTQTVVDILVASISLLAVDGYAIWRAVGHYRQGNVLAAVAFTCVVAISLLLIGFIILRRIIRKKK